MAKPSVFPTGVTIFYYGPDRAWSGYKLFVSQYGAIYCRFGPDCSAGKLAGLGLFISI